MATVDSKNVEAAVQAVVVAEVFLDDLEAVVPAEVDLTDREAAIPAKVDLADLEAAKSTNDPKKAKDVRVQEFWPLWKLTLMALPQLGVQVMWIILGSNAAPYLKHLGAPDFLATLNNIAGPVTGFFMGPLVGSWSDRSTSGYGRRRPIIIGGLISTMIAGILYAGSEKVLPDGAAIWLAAPMYWVLDVTINIFQTPFRALVSDKASTDQQVPMQAVFVITISVGNYIAYSLMKIYDDPTSHMLELMLIVFAINSVCVGIMMIVASEIPFARSADAPKESLCSPVINIVRSVKGMSAAFFFLSLVQCFVWVGNGTWAMYGQQWFTSSVFRGDNSDDATKGELEAYGQGVDAFGTGGQIRSAVQLVISMALLTVLIWTHFPKKFLYAPLLFMGAVFTFLASFAVGQHNAFAIVCFVFSILPELACFAIPYGLVAKWNKEAENEGKTVSTALQMSLLNCCITVGQQISTLTLTLFETSLTLQDSLTAIFTVAGVAYALAGAGALFLKDGSDNQTVAK